LQEHAAMTLKQRIAILAPITCSAFTAAGLCRLSADLLYFYAQPAPWIGEIGWAATGIAFCLWIYLSFTAPERRQDEDWTGPWTINRWIATAVAVAVVTGILLFMGASRYRQLAANLVLDGSLLGFAITVWIRWGIWNDILDDWAANLERRLRQPR
jgi:hypothetical protein